MNRSTGKHVLAAAALATLLAPGAFANDNPMVRMISSGSDGGQTHYTVRCRDKRFGTVVVDHASEQICAQAQGAEPRCASDWTLNAAGRHACTSSSNQDPSQGRG